MPISEDKPRAVGKLPRIAAGIFRWLGVFAPSEPDGVPLMAGGERVGTIAPDGTLILKPGLDYRPLCCGTPDLPPSGPEQERRP